jgi:hypothetical protein
METFYTKLLPLSSTLKIQAEYFFETLINAYQNILRHIPEGHDFHTAGRRRRLEDTVQAILKR